MNPIIRKISAFGSFLILGIILGILLSGFVFAYYAKDLVFNHAESLKNTDILHSYLSLDMLRQNNTTEAIEILENNLDDVLLRIYVLNHERTIDDIDRNILEGIRKYRTRYPRKSEIPERDVVINNLLFHSPQYNAEPNKD